MRAIRGNEIAMIFQEPMTSLNPVLTVGAPDRRELMLHQHLDARARRGRAPSRCCAWWASPSPSAARANIRTSFPAACASG